MSVAPNSVENIVVERGRREVGVVTIVGVGVSVGPLNYGVIRAWVGKWQVIVVVDMCQRQGIVVVDRCVGQR